jgi:integrase/recombinase XerD
MKSETDKPMPSSQAIIPFLPSISPAGGTLPALFEASPDAGRRFLEFFTVNIRNAHTRRAYFKAIETFAAWCDSRGLARFAAVQPFHVAGYVEQLGRSHSKPTVKQHLAAIRTLFDWLVTGQIMPSNPAHAVRGPKHSVRKGKTSVLDAGEMRALLASIDTGSLIGLRDRALIALMGYTFARVSGAVGMKVEDFYIQNRRGWVRLHEKGGKVTELPCHHNLDQYLEEWIAAADLAKTPDAPLFPTLRHGRLAESLRPLPQANVHAMIQRRSAAAGIRTKISAHSFRATGITNYLQNGGKLEVAQAMAGHESARTTGLYDRRNDAIALDEVERIAF